MSYKLLESVPIRLKSERLNFEEELDLYNARVADDGDGNEMSDGVDDNVEMTDGNEVIGDVDGNEIVANDSDGNTDVDGDGMVTDNVDGKKVDVDGKEKIG